MTFTVTTARQYAREQGLERLDADILLAHALNRSRTWLFTWPERSLDPDQDDRFRALVRRRLAGEPVAHLVGRREFWSLPIAVNASTLIPRPDTECLVEAVLERFDGAPRHAVDLGTGTGAIALALASERPEWRVTALDRVAAACDLARHNARALGLPVEVVQGHWCDPLGDASVDVLVSNPPYIDADDPHLSRGDVRFEPRTALVAADRGLADLRALAQDGRRVLVPGGWLVLEHGWDQGEAVRALLAEAGYRAVTTGRDHGDRERYTLGQRR